MNKICIIGVYFGKLPAYFELFLKSCRFNRTIDFYIFTDNVYQKNDDNIFFVKITLDEMKKRASNYVGFNVALDKPYKCCDYRPIYGMIFADFVKNYDYVGHCDFDVIFGDLQGFFDKYELYKYDKFLTRGHLSLYRNKPEVWERYSIESGHENYKDIFTHNRSFVFDEDIITDIYINNKFPLFKKLIFADISPIHHRFRLIERYPYDNLISNFDLQVFYWDKGHLFRTYYVDGKFEKDEFLYIHFKRRPNYIVDFDIKESKSFYIGPEGFSLKCDNVSLEQIKKYNSFPGSKKEKREKDKYLKEKRRILKKHKRQNNKLYIFFVSKKEILYIRLRQIYEFIKNK